MNIDIGDIFDKVFPWFLMVAIFGSPFVFAILSAIYSHAINPCPSCGKPTLNGDLVKYHDGVCPECHFRIYRKALEEERLNVCNEAEHKP